MRRWDRRGGLTLWEGFSHCCDGDRHHVNEAGLQPHRGRQNEDRLMRITLL